MASFRRLGKKSIIYTFVALFETKDSVSKDSSTVINADLSAVQETGIDRLGRMFRLTEHDDVSPEVSSILQVGFMSAFVGALYGGVVNSKKAYIDFINNNQATMFSDHLEAKKKLQEKVTKSFGVGAFRWGWRLSLFSVTYMTVSTSVSVYRGKFGIVEHLAAGTVAGFCYKFPHGPRGWIVGSILGCVLGAFAGSLTYGLLKLTGSSWEEVRYWQYQWKETRNSNINETIKKGLEKDELLIMHDLKVGDTGKSIDNIDIIKNETTKT